jgi:hypothetical protein
MELPEFQWLNTVLGNVKNAMQGTYHKAGLDHNSDHPRHAASGVR